MIKDPVYLAVVGLTRTVFFAQGLKFTISGMENIPKKTGAVIVTNHTGYMDFTYVGLPFRKYRRFVRFMAKKQVFDHPVAGPIMRALKHIPVDRTDGQAAFEHALRLLRDDELVGVFPESTISRSFEVKNLKPGAVRMSMQTGKPIIPVLIVGSQRVWTKGHPKRLGRTNTPIHMKVLPEWYPSGDEAEATQQLHQIMDRGVRELWDEYAAAEGGLPVGAYWVPARLGGGAPSFAEAQSEDLKVEKERKRVRTLRKDLMVYADRLREIGREFSASARDFSDQTKATIVDATHAMSQNMSEETARARLQAKEQTTAILAQFQQSVEQLADEVTVGAKEGADSVRAASESMREALQETYGAIETAADAGLESSQQSIFWLIAQSKLIRDRLPARVARHMAQMPEALVLDYASAMVDSEGAVPQNLVDELAAYAGLGCDVFIAHDVASAADAAALTDRLTQSVAGIAKVASVLVEEGASRQAVTSKLAELFAAEGISAEHTMVVTGDGKYAEAMMLVGLPAVTVDADWMLIRTADWVIDTADHGGPALVLAALRETSVGEDEDEDEGK